MWHYCLKYQLINCSELLDVSGKRLRIEAIATVQALESMLLSRVAKQWYDFDRKDFIYVKQIKAGFNVS